MRDATDDRDTNVNRIDPVEGEIGALVGRAVDADAVPAAPFRQLVLALSARYVPCANKVAGRQAFAWYLKDVIQDQVQAIVERAEAGDAAARALLVLHRQSIEPRGWTLFLQDKEVFLSDDEEEACYWGELGCQADRVLKRCTGEFDCDHPKGTPNCAISWRAIGVADLRKAPHRSAAEGCIG